MRDSFTMINMTDELWIGYASRDVVRFTCKRPTASRKFVELAFEVPVDVVRRFGTFSDILDMLDEDGVDVARPLPRFVNAYEVVYAVFRLLDRKTGIPESVSVMGFLKMICGSDMDINVSKQMFESVLHVVDYYRYEVRYVSALVYMMARYPTSHTEFERWRANESKELIRYFTDETKSVGLEHLILAGAQRTAYDVVRAFYYLGDDPSSVGVYDVNMMRVMIRNILLGYTEIYTRRYMGEKWILRANVIPLGTEKQRVMRMCSDTAFDLDPPHVISSVVRNLHDVGDQVVNIVNTSSDVYEWNPHTFGFVGSDAQAPLYPWAVHLQRSPEQNRMCYFEVNAAGVAIAPRLSTFPKAMRFFMYGLPIQVIALMAMHTKHRVPVHTNLYAATFMELYQRKMHHIQSIVGDEVRSYAGKWRMVEMTTHGLVVVAYDDPRSLQPLMDHDEIVQHLPTSQADMIGTSPVLGDVVQSRYGITLQQEWALRRVESYMIGVVEPMRDDLSSQTDRLFFTPWGGMYFLHGMDRDTPTDPSDPPHFHLLPPGNLYV